MQTHNQLWSTKLRSVIGSVLLAVTLLLAFLWGMLSPDALASVGGPQPGTVLRAVTYTYLSESAGVTGTTYTDAPLVTAGGLDLSRSSEWHAADVFVTADLTGTDRLTVTVQVSADQEHWADADYDYVAQSGTVVNSGAVTSTITTASAITTQPYRAILTADGTEYLRVPLAGEYLRFKIERTGNVTATVLATLRND